VVKRFEEKLTVDLSKDYFASVFLHLLILISLLKYLHL